MNEQPEHPASTSKRRFDRVAVKKAFQSSVNALKRLNLGAGDLIRKFKKDKSPEAMLATVEEAAAANRDRREKTGERMETLYRRITSKKAEYAKAPAARRGILEAELRSLLAEHKAGERELKILLENERVLSQVKGRLYEVASYDMAGVTEAQIDDLVEEVEESVEKAEGRMDAARDLERAGRRRERESDHDDFMAELEAFEAAEPAEEPVAPASHEEPTPAEPIKKPAKPAPEVEG